MGRAADETLLGRVIAGKYLVESFLGGGAMGSVYRARQRDIDKAVAIKVLHRELIAEPLFAARFKREAKAASRLDHPNSMRVLDFGEEPDGICFIVMELLVGRNLFHILKAEAPLSRERIVDFLRQILAALAVAHDMGVVHRDLKPENIIVLSSVDDDGRVHEVVKVCDFGMAKISASRLEEEEHTSEKLTSHGVVVGTPEYMSPEQGKGESLDGRSDLYSVGVILYQLLTGRLPFTAESAVGVLLKHLIEEPVPPAEIHPDVDPLLESVTLRAMRKRPEERFASAREMRAAIGGVGSEKNLPLPAPSGRALVAGDGSKPRRRTREEHAIGEAATVEVHIPAPPTMTGLASVQAPPRSLRLARDILSVPPPPRRRGILPFLLGVAVLGGLAFAAVTGRVPGLAFMSSFLPRDPVAPAASSARPFAPAHVAPTAPDAGADESPASPAASSAVASPDDGGSTRPSPVGRPGASTLPDTPAAVMPTAVDASAVPDGSTPAAGDGGSLAHAVYPVSPSAHIEMGSVTANGVAPVEVVAALPLERFNGCYRDTLRATGGPTRGAATLHLDIDPDGEVAKASFEGTEALREVGNCIVNVVLGRRVHNLRAGAAADAMVPLSFKVE
jgi:serine/threonine-protein kinase